MYQGTEIVPMEIPNMIPMALCNFCSYQSGELEMRIHFIQSHYDHVSKFWKVCKFCARYYPTDLELKNHITLVSMTSKAKEIGCILVQDYQQPRCFLIASQMRELVQIVLLVVTDEMTNNGAIQRVMIFME